jgi:hypothetical protein
MKSDKPVHGSGKTYFNRIKAHGQSWIELRDKAIQEGRFKKK